MAQFSQRQWITLLVFGIANFCNAICVSLQAPFYPMEAEKKGATATEYGLVFGVFELVVFIVSPLYGKHLNRIGPKLLFNGGIFTVGSCAILFGLLDRVEGHYSFISLSFLIRIVEALGNAAFLTASFAIIAKEFPDSVATTFASLETFFGFGLIAGPTVGGALYQIGGYMTPFAVMGSLLFLSAVMTALVLPDHGESSIDAKPGPSVFKVVRIPGVALAACSIIATSVSIGFLQATLEPHLRKFDLSPVVLGLMFVINGGTYAVTAPAFGWLCDRHVKPKTVTIVGCILVIVGFCLVGPAPFFYGDTVLWVSILGLVCHGLGMAAQLVASFTDALRTSFTHGYPNNLETYGLISGLWTSTFALGAFIGPSVAGVLFDSVGFRDATMVVVACQFLVAIGVSAFLICERRRGGMYKEIPPTSDVVTEPIENGGGPKMNGHGPHGGDKGSTGGTRGHKRRGRATGEAQPIERPPGMVNGLSVCSSYKNSPYGSRYGTWKREDGSSVLVGPFSSSYGTLDGASNGAAITIARNVALMQETAA